MIKSNNSQKKIVIVGGVARSGKDTFVDACLNHVSGIKLSMIDPVKAAATALGIPTAKTEQYRHFLVDLKALWDDSYNGSLRYLDNCLDTIDDDHIAFVMARQPQEIQAIENLYPKSMTVLVDRPGINVPNNVADQTTKNYNYNLIVRNDGTKAKLLDYSEHLARFLVRFFDTLKNSDSSN